MRDGILVCIILASHYNMSGSVPVLILWISLCIIIHPTTQETKEEIHLQRATVRLKQSSKVGFFSHDASQIYFNCLIMAEGRRRWARRPPQYTDDTQRKDTSPRRACRSTPLDRPPPLLLFIKKRVNQQTLVKIHGNL